MKSIFLCLLGLLLLSTTAKAQLTAEEVLQKMDANMSSDNRKVLSKMTIHGKRRSRTIKAETYSVGVEKSLTEYLSPAREKGTKMLKLGDKLWIYSPKSDRSIQLSGHMLKQSMMGSDISYEDMMEDQKRSELYEVEILREEEYEGEECWVLGMQAKAGKNPNYHSIKAWVTKVHYIPLQEKLYAKSGEHIKSIFFSRIEQIDGRWFPLKMRYKDELSSGAGTEFEIEDIEFDIEIPEYLFNKSVLGQ